MRLSSSLLKLSFDARARVRGDAQLKRVTHDTMNVSIEHRDEVGLLLNLTGQHQVRGRLEGRFSSHHPRCGTVSVLPPGCRCDLDIMGRCSVVMLRLDWGRIRLAANRLNVDLSRTALKPRLNEDAPEVSRLIFTAASAESDDVFEGAVDSIAEILVAGSSSTDKRHRTVGLPEATLRRVVAACDESPTRWPILTELAAVAGMSTYHFARSFKIATGESPHAYLVRRRVADALALLASTALSVGDIARVTGFAHASHLARYVRRTTGVTPEAYRRAMLP